MARYGRDVKTLRRAHREHHGQPNDLTLILLEPKEAAQLLLAVPVTVAVGGGIGKSAGRAAGASPPTMFGVKQINCVCGYIVKGEDDDELWAHAQEHLRSDHPDLAGAVSREDILAQAEEASRTDEVRRG